MRLTQSEIRYIDGDDGSIKHDFRAVSPALALYTAVTPYTPPDPLVSQLSAERYKTRERLNQAMLPHQTISILIRVLADTAKEEATSSDPVLHPSADTGEGGQLDDPNTKVWFARCRDCERCGSWAQSTLLATAILDERGFYLCPAHGGEG
jgi:hypothetical protein